MNRWLRRILILLLLLFWLAVMLLPTMAFVLARNGQLQVGQPDNQHWRLFLLQDAEAEGLGLERARVVEPPSDAPATTRCLQTTISYWFWSADSGQDASYCSCIDTTTGASLSVTPPACLLPDIP